VSFDRYKMEKVKHTPMEGIFITPTIQYLDLLNNRTKYLRKKENISYHESKSFFLCREYLYRSDTSHRFLHSSQKKNLKKKFR